MQFAKAPIPGQVKTRLQPAMDEAACLELHCDLVRHTFQQLKQVKGCDLQLWVSRQDDFFLDLVLQSKASIQLQQGVELGDKMARAIRCGLNDYDLVVLVGSDCPGIDPNYIQSAMDWLRSGIPVVLGPAHDGGYGLIAMQKFEQTIFDGVRWGSDQVLQQTRDRLNTLDWYWHELPQIHDIDRPEDLAILQSYKSLAKFYYEH